MDWYTDRSLVHTDAIRSYVKLFALFVVLIVAGASTLTILMAVKCRVFKVQGYSPLMSPSASIVTELPLSILPPIDTEPVEATR